MLISRVFYCFLSLGFLVQGQSHVVADRGFARTSGTHFVMDGKAFYINGFNSYWLMIVAFDENERWKVSSAFRDASKAGMNVARTWAFSDGGYRSLQINPGVYNEDMFKGLDFVISEAGKYGIHLILSLVNNYADFGGRKQYVEWAKDEGQTLTSDDDFYRNAVVKGYYKNHIRTVLTRINTIRRMAYKDDPTIFAWELINEPQCESDLSAKTLQDWISEMAGYVKSIDSNHLLEIGLEGFYGESKKQSNPNGYLFGTDFISNNQIEGIDFATIHAYPDLWLKGSSDEAQLDFMRSWSQVHVQDCNAVLKKPLLLAEFGKSTADPGYNVGKRDAVFGTVYDLIYASASGGGSYVGGLFWQLLEPGMNNLMDGYQVIMAQNPSTAGIIATHSNKLSKLNH